MPFDEDLRDFYDADEFGTAAVIGGVAVVGIFDDGYNEVLGAATDSPMLMLAEASARCAVGESITVGGAPYIVRERQPDGTGMVTLILEEDTSDAGEGLRLNMAIGWLTGPTGYKQNDHGMIRIGDTIHLMGIRCLVAYTGSEYLSHYSSPDCRSWTEHDTIELGTGIDGNWRCQVWAPKPFLNQNYGGSGLPAGCYAGYKYLMLFTGASRFGAAGGYADNEQKIGIAGALDDAAVAAGEWTVLNGDAPIYWLGMDDTGNGGSYPGGAPYGVWIDYNYATRDPDWFEDSFVWRLTFTYSEGGGVNGIGLARFNLYGHSPIWNELTHEAAPLVVSDDSGTAFMESTFLLERGSLWHLFPKGTDGTRHQSADAYTGPAGGWDGSKDAGVAVCTDGPVIAEASEVVQTDDADVMLISGHYGFGTFYGYKFLALDFSAVAAEGDHPTPRHLANVQGLGALRDGALDVSFRWHHGTSGASGDAFYYQPVVGDEPLAAGGDASGMSSTSYINTAFKRYYPGFTAGAAATTSWGGWIYSDAFTITKVRAELKLAGDEDASRRFVALVRDSDGAVLHIATGNDSHVLETVTWNLAPLVGTSVRLVIADLSDTDNPKTYGISVDYFVEYTPAAGEQPAAGIIEPVLADQDLLEDLLDAADSSVKEIPW